MSTKITRKDLDDTKARMFFIVGTSRSGSTLLQSMLNAHSKVVIPPETHFFKTLSHLKRVSGNKPGRAFSRKLINFWYEHQTRVRDLGLSREEVLAESENLSVYDPVGLFNLHLTMYRKQRGKSIAGEKTPLHILHIQEMLEAYPNAKVISMFRDPRAAAWSEIKAYFGSPSVIVSTRRWRKYIRKHEELKRVLSEDQYLMLQYRDLIDAPEKTLKKVSGFLDIQYEAEMLNFHEREEKGFADGEKSWKKGTLKPLQKNRNEEWKSELADWQVALIEDIAGEYLQKMDYEAAAHRLPIPKKIFYQGMDMGRSLWATATKARDEGYISPDKFKL